MRTKNKYSGFSRKKEKQRFLTFRPVVIHCFLSGDYYGTRSNHHRRNRTANGRGNSRGYGRYGCPSAKRNFVRNEPQTSREKCQERKEKRRDAIHQVRTLRRERGYNSNRAVLDLASSHSSKRKTIRFIVEDMDLVTFISTTVALCASILWNFTFNRKFTFKDAGNVPKAMLLAFLFYVPFYPFQTWYVHTIKSLLLGPLSTQASGIIAEGSVMVINFVLEFVWQKFVVFRKKAAK